MLSASSAFNGGCLRQKVWGASCRFPNISGSVIKNYWISIHSDLNNSLAKWVYIGVRSEWAIQRNYFLRSVSLAYGEMFSFVGITKLKVKSEEIERRPGTTRWIKQSPVSQRETCLRLCKHRHKRILTAIKFQRFLCHLSPAQNSRRRPPGESSLSPLQWAGYLKEKKKNDSNVRHLIYISNYHEGNLPLRRVV